MDLKLLRAGLLILAINTGWLILYNFYFYRFSPTLPYYDSSNRGTLSYFTSLGTIMQNTHSLCEVFVKRFLHFHHNGRLNCVFNYFFGKLKILLNHGFPRPISPTKPALLLLGTLGKVKFP